MDAVWSDVSKESVCSAASPVAVQTVSLSAGVSRPAARFGEPRSLDAVEHVPPATTGSLPEVFELVLKVAADNQLLSGKAVELDSITLGADTSANDSLFSAAVVPYPLQ